MTKKIAIGLVTFVMLVIGLGFSFQVLLELFGLQPSVAGQISTHLVATPIALWRARRIGHVTHISLGVASVAVALFTLWAIVYILNAIAQPAGGHVGWGALFTPVTRVATLSGVAAQLLVPQAWLWLFNRMSANNSFKPTPLRGAA